MVLLLSLERQICVFISSFVKGTNFAFSEHIFSRKYSRAFFQDDKGNSFHCQFIRGNNFDSSVSF